MIQGGSAYTTWIDRAGVRQDDDLRARLLDRVPSWALLAMLASLLSTASVLLPVLASFAEVRRMSAAAEGGASLPTRCCSKAHKLSRIRYRARAHAARAAVTAFWFSELDLKLVWLNRMSQILVMYEERAITNTLSLGQKHCVCLHSREAATNIAELNLEQALMS